MTESAESAEWAADRPPRHRPRRSLQTLVLVGMAAVTVVLATTTVLVTATTRGHLMDQVDNRLEVAARADRDRQLDDRPAPHRTDPGDPGDPGSGPPERLSDVFEGEISPDGELVVFFTPNLTGDGDSTDGFDLDQLSAVDTPSILTVTSTEGRRYRMLARPLDDAVRLTAVPLDDVDRTISRLILVQLLGCGAVLLMLGAVTWWVIRLGVTPLRRMTDTATELADGDLTVRIPEATAGTEAAQLARALNHMLARIRVALEERARSEDRLRRFVSDASHELRTPVTTIQGYAQLYRAGGLADATALDDAMARTGAEAARMARLVEEMLTLARLDEERPLELASVDLAALARDAVGDATAVRPDRPVTLRDDGPVPVTADEDRLRQVVANVVTNALVHTGPDTVVTVSAHGDDTTGRVVVADDGPGMAPDVVARVTERFYRADPSRSRATGGSGLGLAITEAALRAHGGRLEIDSRPGRGTTVALVVPRSGRLSEATATVPPTPPVPGRAPRQTRRPGPTAPGTVRT